MFPLSSYFEVHVHIDKAGYLRLKQLTNTPKKRIWNQYTLFDSLCFSQSNCGSRSVKTYTNKRWRKKSGVQRARTSITCPAIAKSSFLRSTIWDIYPIQNTRFNLAKYRQWVNVTRDCAMHHVLYYFELNRKQGFYCYSLSYLLTTINMFPYWFFIKLLYTYDSASLSHDPVTCNIYPLPISS